MRVVDMRAVDISTYRFDYDLTLAFLMMNADGTIYHVYGGRDESSAMSRQSMASLVKSMRDGVAEHEAYMRDPKPPKLPAKRTIEDVAPWNARLKKNNPNCIHCHMVNNALREEAKAQKRWTPESIWIWPLPDQAGFRLDRDDQELVKEVAPKSASAAAGLKAGDRLVSANGLRVRTEADVQRVLDEIPFAGGALRLEVERDGAEKTLDVKLAKGWRAQTPLEYSWRPFKWELRPNPGFGGPDLSADEKKKLGLKADAFAFKVGYIIDWGDHPGDGENVKKAGLRKGDVVISVNGKADLKGSEHFQTWFRLSLKPGQKVEYVVLRDGKKHNVSADVLP